MILPSDHPLAEREAIDPHDLVGETFIGVSTVPRVLRAVIDDYLKRSGIEITPHLEIDNFAMAISLVASTRGVALLPASAENFLPWSVISRPLKGEAPTIDLVVGYHKANTSPILRTFLSRIDDLIARISSKARRMSGPESAARRDDGSADCGGGACSSSTHSLPVSASTNSLMIVIPSASAKRVTAARCASIPSPERCCRSVDSRKCALEVKKVRL